MSYATTNVTVLPDNRTTIFVSPTGNDNNDGLSPWDPIQSISEVNQLLTSNMRVLFQDGGTYDTASSLNINGLQHVFIGSYGNGNDPVLGVHGSEGTNSIINIGARHRRSRRSMDLRFQFHLHQRSGYQLRSLMEFSSTEATSPSVTMSFLNVNYAVNTQFGPSNVLVQDNNAHSATTAFRISPSGSREPTMPSLAIPLPIPSEQHNIRIGDGQDILVAYNNLSNVSGAQLGQIHRITSTIRSPSSPATGPMCIKTRWSAARRSLGRSAPLRPAHSLAPESLSQNVVLDSSTFDDSLTLMPGAHRSSGHSRLMSCSAGNVGIFINSQESIFGRQVQNVWISNNTVVDSGQWSQYGGFLKIADGVPTNVNVNNNLFVDPNLVTGNDASCRLR